MGLFRRREAPAEPMAPPEPAEPTVALADPGPPAWATLPPLTPTIRAPESTFKIGAAVKEDLVALDSPRFSHGMGHLVSSDGPPGVISGLARTTVQRQASTSSGGPLDMPMAPTSVEAEPEPAAATTVFLPGVVPSGNGNGDGSGEAWSPPASPISAAAAAPPPSRELPLAPSIQRQADPAAPGADSTDVPSPVPEDQAPDARPDVSSPAEPTSASATEGTPAVQRASDEPAGATSVRPVQRASAEPSLTLPPTVARASAETTGADPTGGAATVPLISSPGAGTS